MKLLDELEKKGSCLKLQKRTYKPWRVNFCILKIAIKIVI